MYKGECTIAKVIDDETLVINRGAAQGVEPGQRFQAYAVGEEIIDPDTKKSLGRLEIVKGTGRAVHVQENLTTVRSDMKSSPPKTIRKPVIGSGLSLLNPLATAHEIEEQLPALTIPFTEPKIGDKLRTI